MRRITGLLAVSACFLTIDGSAAAPSTTSTLAYKFAAGTRLDFETSASFAISGEEDQKMGETIKAAYIILGEKAGTADVFISAVTESKGTGRPSGGARFTCQMEPTGEIASIGKGFTQPPFAGWSPNIEMPRIMEPDSDGKVQVEIPLVRRIIPADAETATRNGEVEQNLRYASEPTTAPDSTVTVRRFSATLRFSIADGAPLASSWKLEAEGAGPTGEPNRLRLHFESKRTSLTTLDKDALAGIREDIAMGASVISGIESALGMETPDTTKVLELAGSYLEKYPKGAFAAPYAEIRDQITLSQELMRNAANATEGKPAPAFEAKTLEGETIRLSDLLGKVVLLDFWATWCGPCRIEMPGIKALYEQHKDSGFTVVGISGDKEEGQLRDFIREQGIAWKQVFEPTPEKGTVHYTYGVFKYPTSLLIDRKGTIRMVDARGAALADAVAELVKEK